MGSGFFSWPHYTRKGNYRQILKNYGVNTVKANIMAGAVGAWQFVSPQWWGIEK